MYHLSICQSVFGNGISLFLWSISVTLLPQINLSLFFSPLFQQCHCHKSICHFFFFSFYFGTIIFFKKWYVHNIFTTLLQKNPKCQIVTDYYYWGKKVILMLDSNLNQQQLTTCRVHLDWAYCCWKLKTENWKLKIENWKHCSKIIFKCVNSNVGPIFNIFFMNKVVVGPINST